MQTLEERLSAKRPVSSKNDGETVIPRLKKETKPHKPTYLQETLKELTSLLCVCFRFLTISPQFHVSLGTGVLQSARECGQGLRARLRVRLPCADPTPGPV